MSSGRDDIFVDDSTGEAPGGHFYIGRIGQLPLHIISSYGGEMPPTFSLVSGRDGGGVAIGDNVPLFSPDSLRFAVDSPNWENCTEDSGASLSVWRLTADSLPVREWRIDSGDCGEKRGWGATDLTWRSPDTLSFTENDLSKREDQHEQRRVLLVRDGQTWRIVDAK